MDTLLHTDWWFSNPHPPYPPIPPPDIEPHHSTRQDQDERPEMTELPTARPSVLQSTWNYSFDDAPSLPPAPTQSQLQTIQSPYAPSSLPELEFQPPNFEMVPETSAGRPSVLAHGSDVSRYEPNYNFPYYATRVDELLFSQPIFGNIDPAVYLGAIKKDKAAETKFKEPKESSESAVIPKEEVKTPQPENPDLPVCRSTQANGLHFGARTCAACAAFFRRTISDAKKYICKRSQRCTTASRDGYRKICRACRLKRCMECGMLPENVQNKRHVPPTPPLPIPGGPLPGLTASASAALSALPQITSGGMVATIEATVFVRDERRMKEEKVQMRLPDNYYPDTKDKHYRSQGVEPEEFHSIGQGQQAMVIGAILQKGAMGGIDAKSDSTQENGNIGAACRVAAKRYTMSELKEDKSYRWLMRELQNTQFLVHPNIVRLEDTFFEPNADGTVKYTWIVTERMETTLQAYINHINRPEKMDKPRDHRHVAAVMTQIFMALDFLHHRGVIHRDLNPKNVGLNLQTFDIKLLDFGCSGLTVSDGSMTTKGRVGTPHLYRPPELLVPNCPYDSRVDVWAVGLIALEMLGKKLFLPSSIPNAEGVEKDKLFSAYEAAMLQRVLDVLGVPEDRYEEVFGNHLARIDERPSKLREELQGPLGLLGPEMNALRTADLENLLYKIFTVNPQRRPTATNCLRHPYLVKMHEKYKPTEARGSLEADKREVADMLERFSKKLDL
ncbi:unnamed protein product, partial [Mesorhabditis spiculigera]